MPRMRTIEATVPVILLGAFAVLIAAGAASAASLANPATVLCLKDGATIAVETAPNGSQHNVCIFPNGARINEWAYFRNKHRSTH